MGAILRSGSAIPIRAAKLRSLFSTGATAAGAIGGEHATRVVRSRRDWIVDSALFVIAVLWCLLGVFTVSLGNGVSLGAGTRDWSPATTALIVAGGGLACLALWLRRRWAGCVALRAVVLGTVSVAAAVASRSTAAPGSRSP